MVLEQLAPRRRGRDPGGFVAGLDLRDQELAARLDEVIGAKLDLVRLAVDQRRPPRASLRRDDAKPGAPQQVRRRVLPCPRARRAAPRPPRTAPSAPKPRQHQRDQRPHERDERDDRDDRELCPLVRHPHRMPRASDR